MSHVVGRREADRQIVSAGTRAEIERVDGGDRQAGDVLVSQRAAAPERVEVAIGRPALPRDRVGKRGRLSVRRRVSAVRRGRPYLSQRRVHRMRADEFVDKGYRGLGERGRGRPDVAGVEPGDGIGALSRQWHCGAGLHGECGHARRRVLLQTQLVSQRRDQQRAWAMLLACARAVGDGRHAGVRGAAHAASGHWVPPAVQQDAVRGRDGAGRDGRMPGAGQRAEIGDLGLPEDGALVEEPAQPGRPLAAVPLESVGAHLVHGQDHDERRRRRLCKDKDRRAGQAGQADAQQGRR